MPKEERAQWERRMSQYERRRRGNALPGDGSRLPNGGNTRVGQRGSGHLAAFSVCLGGRLDKPGTYAGYGSEGEAVGKPGVAGVYTNQRLNLSKLWEGLRKTCQGFKPDPGNLAVRDYRGASENVRHGETVTPHRQLPVFRRLVYPMRGEATNRVLLGRKSPGCPAGVRSGRDDLGGEQTWRPEHNEISASSKASPRTKSFEAG